MSGEERRHVQRVVVKIGSTSLTDPAGHIDGDAIGALVDQLWACRDLGYVPVLVSSGAIASGRGALATSVVSGRTVRHDTAELQALAAVGQASLMAEYAQRCAAQANDGDGRTGLAGQVLLSGHDFGDRRSYLNARATLERLLEWGVLPVVNENDTTATDEIRFGDNDRLAALIATMLQADLLLLLTDTPGLFDADPRLHAEASLIEDVAVIDAELELLAGVSASGIGTGGMASKLAAAKIASWSGVACVIAGASETNVIGRVLNGEKLGTRIQPRQQRLAARKVWIAFALPSRGRLVIDAGAAAALRDGGSLLQVGVRAVNGTFEGGEAVEIVAEDGELLAKGLCQLPSESCTRPGASGELVHRDDMVVLAQ